MKKKFLIVRGLKSETTFALGGRKRIELKPLYKAFTDSKTYKHYLAVEAEVGTDVTNPDVTIDNVISVNEKGAFKMRSTVTTEVGPQKITVEHQLDVTNPDISTKDVNAILKKFFQKVQLPVAATAEA
jgi:hypothetical protein